jgi:hypothetical protein
MQQMPRDGTIPADAVKVTPETDVYPPLLHSTQWEHPVPVVKINTAGAEDSPFVLPDGNTLFFWFTPDVDEPAEEQVHDGVTGIYVSKKEENQWSAPERVMLQDPGKVALDGCVFVQGNIMWFCSIREGNCKDIDIYTAEFKDGTWGTWKNAGEKLNCIYEIGELHISADSDELYFHSGKAGGKGQYDIWVTRKIDGEWQQPENVEAVNTPEHEGWPFLTEDGTKLWFTRTYQGTAAIFRSIQVNGQWGEPEVIISQFTGEPSLDSKGNIYFTHHFFKEGNMIEADIYVAYYIGEEGGSVLALLTDQVKEGLLMVLVVSSWVCSFFVVKYWIRP